MGLDTNSTWFNDELVLFSDAKCNTLLGRNIASRRAMKSNCPSAAYEDLERTPKKKTQQKD
jgi:hypothetical protein